MLNIVFVTEYIVLIEDSAMYCDFVRSAAECKSAAIELGMADVTVEDDGQIGVTYDPPFCYFEGGSLKFNNLGTNKGNCTTTDQCLCIVNSFCAKIPCGEGQGDCDDDSECEGSLVCGHVNCVNSSITDCCALTCNNHSDCLSGECNFKDNTCRYNSDTVDWSKCSQNTPCADGEGDCDHHNDCEGGLLCGTDNCATGQAGKDCCEIYNGKSI